MMSQAPDHADLPSPFKDIGGEEPLRALVQRFYDLMDLEPAYSALRATHAPSLDNAREKLFWFLCGWMGGPNHYIERFGHPRLRARHLPFAIGQTEADQWVACMDQAMVEEGLAPALRKQLHDAFRHTADWMKNQ